MRAAGKQWKVIAADLGIGESTAIYHANRVVGRPLSGYRAVVATLTFLNARGNRWTGNAIAQHMVPPVLKEANRQRAGLPTIREQVTPHTLRYTCITSLFAAGADQDYVAARVGHEDVTTANRIYRYVLQRRQRGAIARLRQLAMRESAVDIGRRDALRHTAGER